MDARLEWLCFFRERSLDSNVFVPFKSEYSITRSLSFSEVGVRGCCAPHDCQSLGSFQGESEVKLLAEEIEDAQSTLMDIRSIETVPA